MIHIIMGQIVLFINNAFYVYLNLHLMIVCKCTKFNIKH